jgi:hypothetical protein
MGANVDDKLVDRSWDRGVGVADSVEHIVLSIMWDSVRATVGGSLGASVWSTLRDTMEASVWDSLGDHGRDSVRASVMSSVWAYYAAPELAVPRFFDEYLVPNALHALAHFNERASGYWLGREVALIVRRPTLLARDAQGRLHSARGKCLEYPDGWGFYAWHGVQVSERVILVPETLTREDFLKAPDVEVRRVIQECMGSRFVSELGGQVIDAGERGTLYEVALPDDPEEVARYVQVQDTSTTRQYFLRVPPTVQTATEAVAWSFQVAAEEYGPAQEK